MDVEKIFYNEYMKNKHSTGLAFGGFLGVLIILYIYNLQNGFNCFSCGFISTNFCNWDGMCSNSSLYVDIISYLSFPFLIVVAIGYFLLGGGIASFYTYVVEFSLFFILYWMMVGYFTEEIIRSIIQLRKNQTP